MSIEAGQPQVSVKFSSAYVEAAQLPQSLNVGHECDEGARLALHAVVPAQVVLNRGRGITIEDGKSLGVQEEVSKL